MKKIFIVLLGLMLVGCQSPQSQPTTNQTKKEKGDLILKEWKYLFWNGDTSKKGYYFLKDEEEKSYIVIMIMLQSKKSIYVISLNVNIKMKHVLPIWRVEVL